MSSSSSAGLRRPPLPGGGGGEGGSSSSSSWTSSPMMTSSSSSTPAVPPLPIPDSGSGLSSRGSSPRGAGPTLPHKPSFHRPPTPGHPRAVKASSDAAAAAPGPPMGPNAASSAPTTPTIGRSQSEDTQDSSSSNYTGGAGGIYSSTSTIAAAGTTSRLHRPRSLPRPPAPRQRNTAAGGAGAGAIGVSRFRLPPTAAASSASVITDTTSTSSILARSGHVHVTPANTPQSSPLVQKTAKQTPPQRTASPPLILQPSSSSPSVVPNAKSPTQPLFLSLSSSSAAATTTPRPRTPPLPEGWTEAKDDSSGRVYYYNAVTGLTTWDRPNNNPDVGVVDEGSSPSSLLAENKMPVASSPDASNEMMTRGAETTTKSVVQQSFTNNNNSVMTPVPAAAADRANDDNNNDNNNNNNVEDFSEAAYATPPESGAALLAVEVTENIQATGVVENMEQDQQLLPGWAEAFDATFNRVYYFNSDTGETRWEKPEPQSPPGKAEETQLLAAQQLVEEEEAVAAPPACPDQPEDTCGANEKQPTNEHQPDACETPAAAAAGMTELPPGWVQATDPTSNRVYYYNSDTEETRWDLPTGSPTEEATATSPRPAAWDQPEDTGDGDVAIPEIPSANESPETTGDTLNIAPSFPLAPGWVESIDPISSRPFYRNTVTGETTWGPRPIMQNAMSQWDTPSEQDQGSPVLPQTSSTDVTNEMMSPSMTSNESPTEVAYSPEEGPLMPSTESPKDSIISQVISVSSTQPEDTFVPGTENNNESEDFATEPLEHASHDRDEQPTSVYYGHYGTSAVPDQSDLPAGWVEAVDPTSLRTYYYNADSDETTWTRPVSQEKQEQVSPSPSAEELEPSPQSLDSSEKHEESTRGTSIAPTGATFDGETMEVEPVEVRATTQDDAEEHVDSAESQPPSELPPYWAQLTDTASQQVYYYNSESGETRWTPPAHEEALIDSEDEQELSTSQSDEFHDTANTGLWGETNLSQEQPEPFIASAALENTVAVDKMGGPPVSTSAAEDMVSLLLPGWEAITDTTSQQVYYYNSETGESRWEPCAAAPPVQCESATSPIHLEIIEPSQSEDFCDAEEIGPTEETLMLPERPATMAVDATLLPESVIGVEEQTENLTTPSPAAEENTGLQPGWTEVLDAATQQLYYYNSESGECRWDRPESVDTPLHEAPPVIQEIDEHPSTSQLEEFQDAAEANRLQDEISLVPEENYEALERTASYSAMSTSASTEKAGPPFGWTEVIDAASQQVYYYNSETGECRWSLETPSEGESETPPIHSETHELGQSEDFCDATEIGPSEDSAIFPDHRESEATTILSPESTASGAEQSPAPEETMVLAPAWEEVTDPSSNRVYYFNNETGETRWSPPPAEAAAPAVQDNVEPSAIQSEEYLAVSEAGQDETPDLLHEQPEASESAGVVDKVDDPAMSSPLLEEYVGLPHGWEEVTDPTSNRTYYFNSETKETRWDPPEAVDTPVHEAPIARQDKGEDEPSASQSEFCDAADAVPDEAPLLNEQPEASESTGVVDKVDDPAISEPSKLKPGWEEVIDPLSSDVYYYNSHTGESQWHKPLLGDEPEQENVKTQDSISQGVEGGSGQAPLESGPHDQPPGQELEDHGWVEVDDPNSELPGGWEKMIDETSGDPYYYNRETAETAWSIPEAPKNEIAEGWVHTKDLNKRKTRKPGKVVATFGFGGRLCMIGSQGCKEGSVVIERTHRIVPKEPLVQAESEKLAAGVVGPLNDADDEKVAAYLKNKAGEAPSDILWNLIWIACQSQGQLRSRSAMVDPDSPETAMVNLLLCNNETVNTNDGSASAGPQIEAVAKDETSLVTIQDLLVRGKRAEAVEEAVRGGHFEIALLVAGICSRETYQQVARQFIERNLPTGSPLHTVVMTFCDPHESSTALFGSDSSQILRTWKSHLASIISNRMPGWDTAVLSLGDRLARAGNHDAAHFCYMVCGNSIANPRHPECRWTLVGCKVGKEDTFLSTETSIIAYARTEAHEWAKRRGNPTATLSCLQAFKVVYARLLADYGFEKAALRYIRSIIDCMAADSSEMTSAIQSLFPFGLAVITSDRAGLLRALGELKERLERNCTPQSSQYESKKPVPVETDVDVSFLSAQSQLPDTQPSWNTGVQSQESGNETFVSIEPQQTRASSTVTVPPPPSGAQNSGDEAPAHSTIPVTQFGASLVVQASGKGQSTFMSPSQPRAQNAPHPAFQTPVNDQPRRTMGYAKEASQVPPPVSLSTPQMQSGEHKEDKEILSEAKAFHAMSPRSLHSQPPHWEGPARQQVEAVSQLPPSEDHPAITRTPVAVPTLTKVAPPPVSAPPNMQKQSKAETPSSASKSGVLSGLRNWMTKKMNPDATQADIGETMTARYDEKLGRWIFPGDDPNVVIPSLAPPPKIPLGTPAPAPAAAPASDDPLAAMMAPPQRGPRSGSRTNSGMRPPGSSPPTTAPPQFAVFTPSPGAKKTSED